jgi:hypothetical protein
MRVKTSAISLAIVSSFLVVASAFALSPPQYTLQKYLMHSIGANPQVDVGEVYEIEGIFYIDVCGKTNKVAEALSVILKKEWELGPTIVRVLDSGGSEVVPPDPLPGESFMHFVRRQFRAALTRNRLYVTTHVNQTESFPKFLWVEVAKRVVQFWNDNLGDYYGNHNEVAASAFAYVCNESFFNERILVQWTTTDHTISARRGSEILSQ